MPAFVGRQPLDAHRLRGGLCAALRGVKIAGTKRPVVPPGKGFGVRVLAPMLQPRRRMRPSELTEASDALEHKTPMCITEEDSCGG